MRQAVKELDRILRGDATRLSALRLGRIEIPLGSLSGVIFVLGALYGLCMGCFALFKDGGASWPQFLTAAVKVPLLFFLTLLVTFPSLYVFNALVGSRLTPGSLLRLLVAALAVMLTVLASLGPIVAFFSASTTSYPFMQLLNVVIFAVSGFLGLKFLLLTLHRLSIAEDEAAARERVGPGGETGLPPPPKPTGALDPMEGRVLGPHVTTVFRLWVVVFGLVGAQMAWVLRPFLGAPDLDFALFRPRGSNFFEAVGQALANLFG